MDTVLAMTALPNLHPALVHFPVALAAVALLFDAVVFARQRWVAIDHSGAALWVLAAAGAGAAYVAGRAAAHDAGALAPAAEAALASHADGALATVTGLGLLALLRVWIAWRNARVDRVPRDLLRVVALSGGFAMQGLVGYTADLGGALVYRHGIAVSARHEDAPTPMSPANSLPGAGIGSVVSHLEDGSFVWVPQPGNGAALGDVLEPLGAAAVRVTDTASGKRGLSLVTSGQALLRLPGSWEDVQVKMRIDPSGFDGSFALGVRIDGKTGGFLRIRSDGSTSLVVRREGTEEQLLDNGETLSSRGERTIGVSVVGRHWKGFIDGRTIAHGHAGLAAPGRVALLLDGTGTVRIVSVKISPVNARRAPPEAHGENAHEH
jgi:uncharacterized membrane protein